MKHITIKTYDAWVEHFDGSTSLRSNHYLEPDLAYRFSAVVALWRIAKRLYSERVCRVRYAVYER